MDFHERFKTITNGMVNKVRQFSFKYCSDQENCICPQCPGFRDLALINDKILPKDRDVHCRLHTSDILPGSPEEVGFGEDRESATTSLLKDSCHHRYIYIA